MLIRKRMIDELDHEDEVGEFFDGSLLFYVFVEVPAAELLVSVDVFSCEVHGCVSLFGLVK